MLCHCLLSEDIIRYVHAKPTWVFVIKKAMENIAYAINSYPWSKNKAGHEKCILEFDSWKTFVFLSNFYNSLTPKPILIKMKTHKKAI